jgi:hypothetical protein
MAAMPALSSDRLAAYRAETYHLRPDLRGRESESRLNRVLELLQGDFQEIVCHCFCKSVAV